MRPNAHLYVRPDAYRFMPPGAPRLVGKEAVRYFWPADQGQSVRKEVSRQSDALPAIASRSNGETRYADARVRWEIAALRFQLALLRYTRQQKTLHPSHYDPTQPRVPKGNPDGGQWTLEGSVSSTIQPALYQLAARGRQSAAYCLTQMQLDMLYCSSLRPMGVVAACRAQANERYAACLAGKPLPPLPF
jgi:hypothetical protein